MATLDIVTVAYRSGEDLEALRRDIPRMTESPHHLWVFDNTGNPKTLTIAWNDLALGGSAEYIAFLNTDVRLSPGWDSRLIEALERGGVAAGAALPRPVGHDWPSLLDPGRAPFPSHQTAPAPGPEDMSALAARSKDERGVYVFAGEGDRASFYAVLVRRADWNRLRGFDERFRLYGQDHDFQRRLEERLSARTVRANGCPVWHRCGGSSMEAAKRGEVDFSAEMRHHGVVKSALRAGRLKDWDLLGPEECRAVRLDAAYAAMPVLR
jgi:hypothetical protein